MVNIIPFKNWWQTPVKTDQKFDKQRSNNYGNKISRYFVFLFIGGPVHKKIDSSLSESEELATAKSRSPGELILTWGCLFSMLEVKRALQELSILSGRWQAERTQSSHRLWRFRATTFTHAAGDHMHPGLPVQASACKRPGRGKTLKDRIAVFVFIPKVRITISSEVCLTEQ